MPRNVRPFWITGRIDGRTTAIDAGPRAKDGGISLRVLMRDDGSPTTALHIDGRVMADGTIVLAVEPDDRLEPDAIEWADGRLVIRTHR